MFHELILYQAMIKQKWRIAMKRPFKSLQKLDKPEPIKKEVVHSIKTHFFSIEASNVSYEQNESQRELKKYNSLELQSRIRFKLSSPQSLARNVCLFPKLLQKKELNHPLKNDSLTKIRQRCHKKRNYVLNFYRKNRQNSMKQSQKMLVGP